MSERGSSQNYMTPSLGVAGDFQISPIQSIPFTPQNGEGQVLAVGAVSVATAQLTLNVAHHFFVSDGIAWMRVGAAGLVAVQGDDFPISPGQVYEYIPRVGRDFIAIIESVEDAGAVGNFYIGRAEL